MSDPCDLTITRQMTTAPSVFIRIEARDGPKLLARIDMSPADFTAAIMGLQITAAISTAKER